MERCAVILLFTMLLIKSCMVWFAMSSSNFTDQSALLAFKSTIRFDPTNVLAHNWTTSTNFCHWTGVTCSTRRQRVTVLDLSYMGLQGTISPHLANLSFLVLLDLSNNSFQGQLPPEFSHLCRLKELNLAHNQIEGVIPPSLHHCRRLQAILLEYNNFTSGIPKEFGILPQLRGLSLGGNSLSGSIPSSIGNISTLEYLESESSGLAGSIPFPIFNVTSLRYVLLQNNSISGTLPKDLCSNCPKLQRLSLYYNHISGHIPSTIYQCTELTHLVLYYNSFNGTIPAEVGRLQKLKRLNIGVNNISGPIPPSLGNISSLDQIYMGTNYIHGVIPNELGGLLNLIDFNLGKNFLSGVIPSAIFNISSLESLSFAYNAFSGTLPTTAGLRLPNLQQFLAQGNQLGGNIPLYLSNTSKLARLTLEANLFTGPVPKSLGNLEQLSWFNVGGNQLTGETGSPELHFLTALTNCRRLKWLIVDYNPLDGIIPNSIGNNSSPLQTFSAFSCQIKGHIPRGVGTFRNLNFIDLSNNNLNGTIPSTIVGLESLQRLYLGNNKIEGSIPHELCHLRNLGELSVKQNSLYGPIPSCIGNLSRLQKLLLSSNALNSSIPTSLWGLRNLIILSLSSNSLSGNLPPDIGKLVVIEHMDLSWNRISGNISTFIGAFERLISLNLSRNSFEGNIPQSFGNLIALEFIDLSHNNLSGRIPKSLEKLSHLRYLNFSFNKLSGEIPNGGPFPNFTGQSFLHNEALCGNQDLQVPPCSHTNKKSETKQILLKVILPTIAFMAVVAFLYMLKKYQESNVQIQSSVDILPTVEYRMISYHELHRATNYFCDANLLGVGSFGSVYKGILSDDTTVAVKILNLQLEGAFKSFDAECEVLRTTRHRNLVKVISTCSNTEFRALVLQYMPNGSLEKWFYSHNYCLDLFQRVSIMFDVALALEYLHHGQSEPIVHCDLKPSNVLLDEDMVAHVCDFGIAKILAKNQTATQTKTLGTLGYIAPEYGSEGRVSTRGDIFSYGIMLLETLTRKKPTDEMFTGELSLRHWVNASLPDKLMEVVDCGLLRIEKGDMTATQDSLLAIMELGLECCKELPEERNDIQEVVSKLNKIKLQLIRNRRT